VAVDYYGLIAGAVSKHTGVRRAFYERARTLSWELACPWLRVNLTARVANKDEPSVPEGKSPGLAERGQHTAKLFLRLSPDKPSATLNAWMRPERGSAGETLGRRMWEPRAARPGVPWAFAQIRQADRAGVSGGMGCVVSPKAGRQRLVGGGVPNGA